MCIRDSCNLAKALLLAINGGRCENTGTVMVKDIPVLTLSLIHIFGGVGGVIVFLPNILILYFFISILEDSGYMARAAFIMDKIMHRMGLHGKSFIPLIMGFGCNVPAIMATRTIEDRKSRLITMLVNPLMSCSARLPIYLVMIGAFFPNCASFMLLCIDVYKRQVAFISSVTYQKTEDLVPFLFEEGKTPLFVMLDGITDVRNFGAIARTCECAGADAIIIPSKNSVSVNADAIKTSAGALRCV